MDPQRRRELGAWYTPPELVDAVVAAVLDRWSVVRREPVTVLDPACGDGRFLAAAATRLGGLGVAVRAVGIDVDPVAVAAASAALGPGATVVEADALVPGAIEQIVGGQVDLVVGNPPFLTPLAARNAGVAAAVPQGAPYADAATLFVMRAWEALAPGGRLGFVLPQSTLANRDAAVARETIAADGGLTWLWWSPRPVFAAAVRTCAIVAERGSVASRVRRAYGPRYERVGAAPSPGAAWSALLADLWGIPPVEAARVDGTVGDRATAGAGFRDQFYGIAEAVGDEADGPPLVTSGLIDPATCWWGRRPIRVARRTFEAPRVDLARLPPRVLQWAGRQLVPKVLVASQTKVIEAVADPQGAWLPGVPVVSVMPVVDRVGAVWELGAVLTNPVAAATLARSAAGSGLSAAAVRVSAKAVAGLPWPRADLADATEAFRAGDVDGCARAGLVAYGIDPASDEGTSLLDWWLARRPAAPANDAPSPGC